MAAKLFIDDLTDGYDDLTDGYEDVIARGFDFLSDSVSIRPGDRVCIKPNLTYPHFKPGVTTNRQAVEAVVRYLTNFTPNITICESDSGGYNRFSMDEVFRATGVDEIAQHYCARIVNMSHEPSRVIPVRARLRRLNVPLPRLLLDETDLFITMPVPKVHINTTISAAIKNQWGVIQVPGNRLKLHPYFKYVIYAVNKSLPRSIAIVDGKYGLTRSGPLRGDPVECQWLLMADNLFYADYVVSRMMGFDPRRIRYLRYILRREKIRSLDGLEANTDFRRFVRGHFYVKREWTDLPGFLTFNSRLLAYVGYESPLAKPLHRLLYKFRQPFY